MKKLNEMNGNSLPITLADLAEQLSELTNNPANATLPAPEIVTYYRFESDRKFCLDLMVDFSAIELVKTIIWYNIQDKGIPTEERKPIWLYIMNYGGDADCGWSLISTILASETPIYTVNLGVCASAAALIFMAGKKRYMFKNATVTIHEGSAQFSGDSTKVLDAGESYKAMLNHMREYITSRTNIPAKLLAKKRNNDWELSSEDCLKYGVCDAVISTISEAI